MEANRCVRFSPMIRRMKEFSQRKAIRMRNWDYGQNACYHVTICTHEKACIFGSVVDSSEIGGSDCGLEYSEEVASSLEQGVQVALSEHEKLCNLALQESVAKDESVELVSAVIMPNHVHLLLHYNSFIILSFETIEFPNISLPALEPI